ncbi:uncharacterized protein LOC124939835 [Impatiens glandulifera]|uniref:uncharacterized protein LOC124939835 n=1 Tax=Impatiens glandulifera TaxID=253017 RepID=UPI001FB198DA|nr:uncharacterized protein LOC124939835 [Impatiens glandulifera]
MNSPEVDLDPKATNNTVNSTSFPVTPLKDNPLIDEEKGNTPNKTSLGSDTNESCNDPTKTCMTGEMIACFQGLGNGIKNIVILVQNEGEITIRVTVKQPSLENTTDPLEVHGHQIGKIDIPVTDDPKIVLNAGSGDCELNIGPSSSSQKEDIFQKFQFYYNQVTPIYGACMFFVVAMIVGGIWSYCKFSQGNQEGEIPYQELEMGSPGSASALNIDSAEGWDQVWDDDWDEENAVRSPVGRKNRVGSVSAKGIPARSSNNRVEDGWDNDWDD